jgi:hypothetical protein
MGGQCCGSSRGIHGSRKQWSRYIFTVRQRKGGRSVVLKMFTQPCFQTYILAVLTFLSAEIVDKCHLCNDPRREAEQSSDCEACYTTHFRCILVVHFFPRYYGDSLPSLINWASSTEQNISIHLLIGIEPITKFEPLDTIPRLKILNALHVLHVHSFVLWRSPYSCMRNVKILWSPTRTNIKALLHDPNNVFFFGRILLGQTK